MEEVEGHDAAHAVGDQHHRRVPVLGADGIELYLHFSTPKIPSSHLLVRRLDQGLQSVEVQTVLIRCSSEVIRRSVDILSANVALEIFSLKHS